MPSRTISTVDQAEALLDGLTLLGTGGGGSPKEWRGLMREKIEGGETFTWTDMDEIDPESYGCTVFKTGSIAPANPQPELIAEMGFTEPRVPNPMVESVHALGRRLGVEIDVVFPVELGGINAPAPISAAMDMGATLADASCSDRSIPELDQIPAIAYGRELAPAAIADTWGNQVLLEAAPSVSAAEHLVKSLSVFTQHADPDAMCAVAMLAMPIAELSQVRGPRLADPGARRRHGDPEGRRRRRQSRRRPPPPRWVGRCCSKVPSSSATGRTRAAT